MVFRRFQVVFGRFRYYSENEGGILPVKVVIKWVNVGYWRFQVVVSWLKLIGGYMKYTPFYLTQLLQLRPPPTHNTQSATNILLKIPKAHTSFGRSPFQFAAADSWNIIHNALKMETFISPRSFRDTITNTLVHTCSCFA